MAHAMARGLARAGLLGVLLTSAVLVLHRSAAGAEPPPADALGAVDVQKLLERLDRLEKRNDELEKTVETLRQQSLVPPSLPAEQEAPENGAAPLDGKAVRSIVGDYLKEQDNRRKQEEEKRQKEAQEKGYEVGSDVSMKASWRDGFIAETPNRDFRVHLGGRLQADVGWFKPDNAINRAFPNQWQDAADFRRVRLRADGTAYEVFDFVWEMEFSQGINGLLTHQFPTDVFVDFKQLPFVGNIAVGHYKEPFSLEDYGTPDSFGVFLERSSADSAFTPDRNIGIMWHNSYCDDKLIPAVGVFRTSSDSRSGNAFDYGDGEYAYTGRVVYVPYYECDGRCWALFGPAYSHRILDPDDAGLPPNNTNPSRARFQGRAPVRLNTPALLDTTALVADSVDLFNFQGAINLGPVLIQSEYYHAQVNNMRRGTVAPGVPRLAQPAFQGFYVQASTFLTGDYHPLDRKWGRLARVRPNENWFFVRRGDKGCHDGFCHGLGAWEVGIRYDYLDLNSRALGSFPAVPGVANSAVAAIPTSGFEQDFTFSLSCYLNPNLRLQTNYVHAWRGVANPTRRGDVDILYARIWWDF